MSSLFSKEIQNQLQELKSQLNRGQKTKPTNTGDSKPTEPVSLPTQKQVQKTVKKLNSDLVDDDKILFMQAMSGVKQLDDKNQISPVNKPATTKLDAATLSKRAAAQGSDEPASMAGLSDMQALLNPVSGDSYLSYKIATLQNKVFNQLKQGKLRWYDAVDIHGCTIEESRVAVATIVAQAIENGETVVKIVHGKGEDAILKTCVNGWLRQMSEVLAFCSATSRDGGNGAVLVLLKKSKAN